MQEPAAIFEEKVSGLTVIFSDRADLDRLKDACAQVRDVFAPFPAARALPPVCVSSVSDILCGAEDVFARLRFRETEGRETRRFTITRNDDGTGEELAIFTTAPAPQTRRAAP